jgi:hypothetical protein
VEAGVPVSRAYPTRGFHALAHDFSIVATSARVRNHFETLFAALPEAERIGTEYVMRNRTRRGAERTLELVRDDSVVLSASGVGALAESLVHYVNQQAISTDYAVTCHAGGVELDGMGIVFPAHMESGKTTLTAGLVRAGFAYLTDEAVAFDRATGLIEPYPKPLSIDAGSHPLFPELEPPPAPGDDSVPDAQWQVPPDAIRPGAVGTPCAARLIVFPTYQEGAVTAIETLAPAAALVELATNTFKFRDDPRRSLETLAEVIRGGESFRLVVGDLHDACRLVSELAVGARDGIRV